MKLKLVVYAVGIFLIGTVSGGFVAEQSGNSYIGSAVPTSLFLFAVFFFGFKNRRKEQAVDESLEHLCSELEDIEEGLRSALEEDVEGGR